MCTLFLRHIKLCQSAIDNTTLPKGKLTTKVLFLVALPLFFRIATCKHRHKATGNRNTIPLTNTNRLKIIALYRKFDALALSN